MSSKYECFLTEWNSMLQEHLGSLEAVLGTATGTQELEAEITKSLKHYEKYFDVKAQAIKENVLLIFCPTWKNPLENAFLWIGGWRPSMIFQLVYSEVGLQLESELAELLKGINSSTLAALSSRQLYQINELQCETLEVEDSLSQKMMVLQQSMEEAGYDDQNEAAIEMKVKEFQNLLIEADRLRFNTLKQLLDNLSPLQSVQILSTAAQFHLSLQGKH